MIQELTYIGNPVLNVICNPVEDFTNPQTQEWADNLIDTLNATKTGIGLAAPQIGINARMFVIRLRETPRFPELKAFGPEIIINPQIISYSSEKVKMRE